jgi:hypothetical protein
VRRGKLDRACYDASQSVGLVGHAVQRPLPRHLLGAA